MYLVRTLSPSGYLFRGRVVKYEANATAYSSPSAARRAEASAVAAGICTKTKIMEIKKMARPKSPGLIQAIKLVEEGKTRYAAHKITGVSQSVIAKAIKPPIKPKCPTCGKTITK